jgi:ribosomal protein L37AE/L43A
MTTDNELVSNSGLQSCPFCGHLDIRPQCAGMWNIGCHKCSASVWAETEALARVKWNTRSHSTSWIERDGKIYMIESSEYA